MIDNIKGMLERKTLQIGPYRPIRSFVERQGRISPADRQAFEKIWKKYELSLTDKQLDCKRVFGRDAPITVEIGFGDGRSLLSMARENPQRDYIGIEVYKAGIVKLLIAVEQLGLTNIRVFCADALEVLNNCIADNSLDQVQLFFPDPWPKVRHHKRRIVQTEFMNLLASKIRLGGTFHAATDWEEYAMHMLSIIESHPSWVNVAGVQQFAERPAFRPLTKFEQRGHRLGYGTWDLIFRKSRNI